MSRRVYKFELNVRDHGVPIRMHVGAKLVLFEQQGARFYVWAEVDPDAENEDRRFAVVGTGHDIPEGYEWRASFQTDWQGAPYVWHLYELPS